MTTPLPPWSQAPLFTSLTPPQRARLETFVTRKRLEPEQILFMEGEPCTGFYVLTEGAIQLTRASETPGAHPTLAVVLPVASFAEAALFGGEAFPATATAIKPTTVYHLPKAAILGAVREDPDLALAIIHAQAVWLRRLTLKVQQLATVESGDRLRTWLQEQLPPSGMWKLPLPKKALAAQLGMTPETLSRALRQLQDAGSLKVEGSLLGRGPRPLLPG